MKTLSEIEKNLAEKIRAMTVAMTNGDKLGVAGFYADNALITDMKSCGSGAASDRPILVANAVVSGMAVACD